MDVIEVAGLRKEYPRLRGGRTVALDGLDLDRPSLEGSEIDASTGDDEGDGCDDDRR